MRLRITPRDTQYFDLFAASASHLVTGANLLAEMLGADRATRKEINKRMAEAEHAADDATHTIMRRLNQTFVTPFDRDDIYDLASSLDDCMDYMDEASDLIVLYKVEELPRASPTRSRCSSAPPSSRPRPCPPACARWTRCRSTGSR